MDLVSLSVWDVKVQGLNKCVNLKNFYSRENRYRIEEIAPLKTLRKAFTLDDEYGHGGACLLQELLLNNKLENVQAFSKDPQQNVINSFTVRDNLENLRCVLVGRL